MVLASKLIECGCILHNLAIKFGFSVEELLEEDQLEQAHQQDEQGGQEEQVEQEEQAPTREKRRNELLACF